MWAFADMLNNSRAKVTMRWISSHSEVKGKEQVAKLAKEAAAGRLEDLRTLLCKTLPSSTSATKQEYTERLKTNWKGMCLTSSSVKGSSELVKPSYSKSSASIKCNC